MATQDSTETAAEKARRLDARLAELRVAREGTAADHATVRDQLARSLLNGITDKGAAKRAAELATELERIDAALALGDSELAAAREAVKIEREAAKRAEWANARAYIAQQLPEVARHLDAALAAIETAAPKLSDRALLVEEVKAVLDAAFFRSTIGKTPNVVGDLETVAARFVPRKLRIRSKDVRGALSADVAVYARKAFTFRDAQRPDLNRSHVEAGAIVLVPAVVAEAARRQGAAEVLPQPAGVRVELLQQFTDESEPGGVKVYPAGWLGVLPSDIALGLFARGAAQPRQRLSEAEIESYRIGRAQSAPAAGPEIDLGEFNQSKPKPAAAAA